MRPWTLLAAVNGFLAVGFGAYAAHGLPAEAAALADRASQYQLVHAVVLLAVQPLASAGNRWATLAGGLFVFGILMFSGSLYWKAMIGPPPVPMLAPAGGFALLFGWLALTVAALRRR
ncbi:MAG: DUF423 domain-containing protein [Rhodospirillales bacterium]|nr:DUF423 domain-containing protein [Rhodospirillales bacterium]